MMEGLPPYDHNLAEIYDNGIDEPGVYESSFEAVARMKVYERAVDKTDTKKQAWDYLRLTGNETIADVGCNDATDLVRLREEYGHQGRLIGVDTKEVMFTRGIHTVTNENLLPIEFIVGQAENLEQIEDNSVDVLQAWAMLYHTDVGRALAEFQRVLGPEGILIASTWGPDNIFMHRAIERGMARVLRSKIPDIKPPEPSTTRFNIPVADLLLPSRFEVMKTFRKACPIHITAESLNDYLLSLYTRYRNFKPVPSGREFEWAMETFVIPFIKQDIDDVGYFTDYMDLEVYVCRNSPAQAETST